MVSSTTDESLVAVGIRATASARFDAQKFTHIEYEGPPGSLLPRVVKQQCFTVNHRVGIFVEPLQFCDRCGRYRTIGLQHPRSTCDQNLREDLVREVHTL